MERIGRCEVVRELGRGGMGRVLLANHPLLGRQVAIKSGLMDGVPEDERELLLKRLIREAQAGGVMNHPNIVAVHDILPDGGAASIVMEFVNGRTLANAVTPGGPIDVDFVMRVLAACADALDHAHEKGVVHRDIKPSNIMVVDGSGAVKITDFGIARIANARTDLTKGYAIGTLEYMSPEQLSGSKVDGRADQFSLAVVAHQLLTRQRLYDADTMRSLSYRIATQPPPPASAKNPALPRAVDGVLAKALGKSSEERWSVLPGVRGGSGSGAAEFRAAD